MTAHLVWLCAALFFVLAIPAWPGHANSLSLTLDNIDTPSLHASRISLRISLGDKPQLALSIGQLSVQDQTWRNVRLQCTDFSLESALIACRNGHMQTGSGRPWPVDFQFWPQQKRAQVSLRPEPGEEWRAEARWGSDWMLNVETLGGSLKWLSPWFPENQPRPGAGRLSGKIALAGRGKQPRSVKAELQFSQLGFSDASGQHAGEKVGLNVKLDAQQNQGQWDWQTEGVWHEGEVYWHPLYLTANGHKLNIRGRYDPQQIRVEQGTLAIPSLGIVLAEGTWSRPDARLSAASVQGGNLDLAGIFSGFVRPFLGQTALAKAEATGSLSFIGRVADGKVASLDLGLANASLQDKEGRFSLRGVTLNLPWRAGSDANVDLALGGGKLLALELGAFSTVLEMRDKHLFMPRLVVPLLDGTLNIQDFHAEHSAAGWQWQFEAGLTPISMEQLSTALKWPKMHGTLAGVIPRVQYGAGKLVVDGALLVKAFDGTIVIQDLALLDPLGRAPRLEASLDMRQLDLDLLTRAFSFGSMQGRVDVAVKGLELSNWKPVAFDASVHSSPGAYPRKISQRAVQNISSLGGAGAAAAIQRSFLGIFKEFGYSQIGLSCVLRNGVCLMDGVKAAPQGYVIVQGGGIPAITVIGYNRSVGWDELIARLQRVTQGNAKPVVK